MRDIAVRRLDKVNRAPRPVRLPAARDKHDEVRLETGDVVYVPLHGRRTQIVGAVLRPAIYELKPGETLPDVLRAAGGFRRTLPPACDVHRILPRRARTGPFPRAVMDVPSPLRPPSNRPSGRCADERISGVFVPRCRSRG